MIRQTSIQTYHQIKSEGLLSKMRLRAYEILFEYGAMTACEVESKEKELFNTKRPSSNLHKRVSELRDLGVAYERCERICSISGRLAIEWDLNDGLPVKMPKKQTKDQIIKELREEIERLEDVLLNERSANQQMRYL